MKNKLRKKTQRQFTQLLRSVNKNIAKDNLWKGRFIVKQVMSDWMQFEDNSGGILWSAVRVYDKKNNLYKDYVIETFPNCSFATCDLNMNIVNKFITEDSGAWNENPYKNIKDYNNVKIDNKKLQYNKERGFSFYGVTNI